MERSEVLDLVTQAVAEANAHQDPTDWDRDVARVALRRWSTFDRRHRTGDHEARVRDLARGLLERFDPDRMDAPGWHSWTAEAAAEALRRNPP